MKPAELSEMSEWLRKLNKKRVLFLQVASQFPESCVCESPAAPAALAAPARKARRTRPAAQSLLTPFGESHDVCYGLPGADQIPRRLSKYPALFRAGSTGRACARPSPSLWLAAGKIRATCAT